MVIYLLQNKNNFIHLDNNIFSIIKYLQISALFDPSFSEHQYPSVVTITYPSQNE